MTAKNSPAQKAVIIAAKQLEDWSEQVLEFASQLRIKTKYLDGFQMTRAETELLVLLPGVSKPLKNKLTGRATSFTPLEITSLINALANALKRADTNAQLHITPLARQLADHLYGHLSRARKQKRRQHSKSKIKAPPGTVYQFKITLLHSNPVIWRRIQVQDCTLDEFHEHIQTAMGWTNSHLHQFEINGTIYGDPELLEDGFEDTHFEDSTTTRLSEILPAKEKRFKFQYEYDFGDGWEHEILLEGSPPIEKGQKYPVCLEGANACPPEDVGGVGGYAEFLVAITDPQHEQHDDLVEWIGGEFAPEKFDAQAATKQMREGLPEWEE